MLKKTYCRKNVKPLHFKGVFCILAKGHHCNHTIVTDHTIRQPGFNLPCHTWSLLNRFRDGSRSTSCKFAQMGPRPITFLRLWPATDHEPHCRHVPTDKIWRRTESTPRSRWWRSHMAGSHSDCSNREMKWTATSTPKKKVLAVVSNQVQPGDAQAEFVSAQIPSYVYLQCANYSSNLV